MIQTRDARNPLGSVVFWRCPRALARVYAEPPQPPAPRRVRTKAPCSNSETNSDPCATVAPMAFNLRPATAPAFTSDDRRRQQRTLSAAAMSGDLELVQSLLTGINSADPSQPGANGLTPLHMVCFSSRSACAYKQGSPEAEAADEVHPQSQPRRRGHALIKCPVSHTGGQGSRRAAARVRQRISSRRCRRQRGERRVGRAAAPGSALRPP